MKRILILTLLFVLTAGLCSAQVVFIQECRDSAGTVNTTFYQETGDGWYAPGSSAKSTAAGLFGTGSRFSFGTSTGHTIGDATCQFYPEFGGHDEFNNPVSFDSGKSWNIYMTVPAGAGSIFAEGALCTITSNGSKIYDASPYPIEETGPMGNAWALVAENVSFAVSGDYVEFKEAAPQSGRFYTDSVKYVEYSTAPTATPTNTPIPRATAVTLENTPIYLVDDGDAGFTEYGASWFPLTVGYEGDCYYRDSKVKVGIPSASATWEFSDVDNGNYAIGFYLENNNGWDYCKYNIYCPNTSVDQMVYGNQQSATQEFSLLTDNIALDGDVTITYYNFDDGIYTGIRFYADALGLFEASGPTFTPVPTDTPSSFVDKSWEIYK